LGIQKPIELLNEHSDQEDIKFLIGLCRDKNVALVTDAGTPSFQDPGFQLVKICREQKIPVTSLPGPASLTCLLSMASERINSFYFAGFLPTDKTDRQLQFKELSKMKGSIILMDTPYRLERTLEEIAHLMPGRKILLGGDMTLESEFYFEGRAKDLISLVKDRKAPFVVLIY
jgi:16S rRNA (cytidine1402-2'-O)-methyltransferase